MVGTGQEPRDAVRYFGDVGMTYYKPLLEAHLPLAPESAHALTCERIEAIAAKWSARCTAEPADIRSGPFPVVVGGGAASAGDPSGRRCSRREHALEPFTRLIGRRASRQDLAQL